MRRALLFDFDGLVIDTESTDFEAWRLVYAEHGHVIPRAELQATIGTADGFDPFLHLCQLAGTPLEEQAVRARRREFHETLVSALVPLPGVVDWIAAAQAHGVSLGVASSSPRSWVEGHLDRLGLLHAFDVLSTSDRVARVKPDPALYQLALSDLGVAPRNAIALEDSPHGVAAAKAAGIFCVAIPGPMTRDLAFAAADRVLGSLAETTLGDVLRERRGGDPASV